MYLATVCRAAGLTAGLAAFLILSGSVSMAGQPPANHFIAHLQGDNEVPPRGTQATGQVIFSLSEDETELEYKLISSNIFNVVAAHIHLGVEGENGDVVAFLAGPFEAAGGRTDGVLAIGTITEEDLVGPLAGMAFSVLIEAMRTGGTYVNVHTNDGVAPANTGPGDFPPGEIRGQIRAPGFKE